MDVNEMIMGTNILGMLGIDNSGSDKETTFINADQIKWFVSRNIITAAPYEINNWSVAGSDPTNDKIIIKGELHGTAAPVYFLFSNNNCIGKISLRGIDTTIVYQLDEIDYWSRIEACIETHGLECGVGAYIECILDGLVSELSFNALIAGDDWTDLVDMYSDAWWPLRDIASPLYERLLTVLVGRPLKRYRIHDLQVKHYLELFVGAN